MVRKESTDYLYLSILTGFIVIGLGTLIHDPYLHSFIAIINGWPVTDYTSGLATGSTDILASINASTPSLWIYFMFPSMSIYIISFTLLLYNPNRLIIIVGLLLLMLNFASLLPNIPGSDAYNAVQLLISRGWSEVSAYTLHYIITFIIILILLLFLYIGIENNPKDARSRSSNIFR